jgi:hypothetical protein
MILWIYVVGILTRPRAGRLGFPIPGRVRNFFSSPIVRTGSGVQPASYSVGMVIISQG